MYLCSYWILSVHLFLDIFLASARSDGIFYLSVLVACASASALDQFLCAYTAIALSEFFVIVRQLPIFLMLDGFTKEKHRSFIYYCVVHQVEKRIQEKYSLFIPVF
jgi:hypothetical protein